MKMIKCQLAMLAFMFCCQGLMAQNSLRVDASLVDTASVIRAWRGDTAVVCVTDGRGTSHFSNACSQRLDESYDYTLPSVSKPLMSDFCTDLPAGGGTWSPVVRDEKSEYICGM